MKRLVPVILVILVTLLSIARDIDAERNILAKGTGVRFTPDGRPEVWKEDVKGNEMITPILRADGGKVTRG